MYSVHQLALRNAAARPLWISAGCVLQVQEGRLWLTCEPASEDVWLLPGHVWTAPRHVRIWISAEPIALLQVLTPLVQHSLQPVPGALRRCLTHLFQGGLSPVRTGPC